MIEGIITEADEDHIGIDVSLTGGDLLHYRPGRRVVIMIDEPSLPIPHRPGDRRVAELGDTFRERWGRFNMLAALMCAAVVSLVVTLSAIH